MRILSRLIAIPAFLTPTAFSLESNSSIRETSSVIASTDTSLSSQSSDFFTCLLPVTNKFPRPDDHIVGYPTPSYIDSLKKAPQNTDLLLDLMYWELISSENLCPVEELKSETVKKRLERSPDHRLWKFIMENDLFDQFPGLVEQIHQYAQDEKLATAYHALGEMYFFGRGVEKNIGKAFTYFEEGTKAEFALSLWVVGHSKYRGLHGYPLNQKTGAQYLQQAADQGFSKAK